LTTRFLRNCSRDTDQVSETRNTPSLRAWFPACNLRQGNASVVGAIIVRARRNQTLHMTKLIRKVRDQPNDISRSSRHFVGIEIGTCQCLAVRDPRKLRKLRKLRKDAGERGRCKISADLDATPKRQSA
jgi:hypothetical protein